MRALSLFHLWLLPLLIYVISRTGYDRRAFAIQCGLTAIVLPVSYAITEPKDNVNWVFGPGSQPQRRLPPLLYLGLVILAFPLLVHGPTHLVLRRVFGDNPKPSSQAGVS